MGFEDNAAPPGMEETCAAAPPLSPQPSPRRDRQRNDDDRMYDRIERYVERSFRYVERDRYDDRRRNDERDRYEDRYDDRYDDRRRDDDRYDDRGRDEDRRRNDGPEVSAMPRWMRRNAARTIQRRRARTAPVNPQTNVRVGPCTHACVQCAPCTLLLQTHGENNNNIGRGSSRITRTMILEP